MPKELIAQKIREKAVSLLCRKYVVTGRQKQSQYDK